MKHRIKFGALLCIFSLVGGPVANAIETAGELYVDLNAADFMTGAASWSNGGTYTDFDAVGAPRACTVHQSPGIVFDGVNDAFVGTDLAPDGLVGFDPTRTIEVWALNPNIAAEETLVSWGQRGGPDGTNMAFNYGNNGMYGAVGHWGGGGHDVGWVDNDFTAGAPEAGLWHHLVYTYDGETTRLYADGELWNSEDTLELWGGLDTWGDSPVAIASQWEAGGFDLTPGLKGSLAISRVRIHDGVLTDEQIMSNYLEETGDFPQPDIGGGDPTPAPIPVGPIHRYSFSNPANGDASGATLIDSVGGADGIVVGDGAEFTGSELRLFGGTSDFAAYGDLPNGLISGLEDLTIETWMTVDSAQNWSRVFDFGSTEPGGADGELEDVGGGGAGLDYLALSAVRGTAENQQRLEIRDEDPAGGGVSTVDVDYAAGDRVFPDEDALYTVVYDSDGAAALCGEDAIPTLSLYRNGELVGSGTTTLQLSNINDVNNWLGRSNWTADSNTEGSYDEFRIYDYALNADQVLGNYEAGPDTVNIGGGGVTGDFNADGSVTTADLDVMMLGDAAFDVTGDGIADAADVTEMVSNLINTWIGDSNGDGEFGTSDFVQVFTIGKFETEQSAVWSEGDWNLDGVFDTSDFVAAFTEGGFEKGPKTGVSAVPEPASMTMLLFGFLGLMGLRRRRR